MWYTIDTYECIAQQFIAHSDNTQSLYDKQRELDHSLYRDKAHVLESRGWDDAVMVISPWTVDIVQNSTYRIYRRGITLYPILTVSSVYIMNDRYCDTNFHDVEYVVFQSVRSTDPTIPHRHMKACYYQGDLFVYVQ